MSRDRGRGRRDGGGTEGVRGSIRRLIFAPKALNQIANLRQHYLDRQRPEAARNLAEALRALPSLIAGKAGLAAPRPYPQIAQPGRLWVKVGRYWIAYDAGPPPVILAVFYDTSDIPGRL